MEGRGSCDSKNRQTYERSNKPTARSLSSRSFATVSISDIRAFPEHTGKSETNGVRPDIFKMGRGKALLQADPGECYKICRSGGAFTFLGCTVGAEYKSDA